MKNWALVSGVFLVSAVAAVQGQAQSNESELAALRERVCVLEQQNQAILKALAEIKAQLGEKERPAAGQAPPAAQAAKPKSQEEPVRWSELVSGESRMKFYGFLRLDLVTDDARPDNAQSALFVLSEDSRVGGKHAANFTLYPRLTRFGINYAGPSVAMLGDSKLSGQLEIDFNNGGRESRQIPRIRHANFKLTHGSFYVLAGQTWDLFSPLFPTVNHDTLMWNAGNLGDRRPQVQAVYEPKAGNGQLSVGAGIGLTGAIDALDRDNNGFRDGEESGRPNLQARVGYSRNLYSKGLKATFGLWGYRGWEKTTRPVAGRNDFYSQSLGVDYSLPVSRHLAFRGEAWFGRNLSDVRGGIGQGINALTGSAIRSRGGWIEANYKAHDRWTVAPGFTTDDPRDQDIPVSGRTRNRTWYLGNRIGLGGGFLVGADYLRWLTDYKGLQRGADNRINIFFQYAY